MFHQQVKPKASYENIQESLTSTEEQLPPLKIASQLLLFVSCQGVATLGQTTGQSKSKACQILV
jgi:hypothetical protein